MVGKPRADNSSEQPQHQRPFVSPAQPAAIQYHLRECRWSRVRCYANAPGKLSWASRNSTSRLHWTHAVCDSATSGVRISYESRAVAVASQMEANRNRMNERPCRPLPRLTECLLSRLVPKSA